RRLGFLAQTEERDLQVVIGPINAQNFPLPVHMVEERPIAELRDLAIGPQQAAIAHSTGLFGHPFRGWSSANQDCQLAAVPSGKHAISHGPVPQSRDALLARTSRGFRYVEPGQKSARVRILP